MATAVSKIITNNFMTVIDDIRLKEELINNPALFFRRAYGYFENAMPLIDRPFALVSYLNEGYIPPKFSDFKWESTEKSQTEETTVSTGMAGYELFSCSILTVDSSGAPALIPYREAGYDAETGDVTFPVQTQAGIIYTMDFYTDGVIRPNDPKELSPSIMRLLGLSCAVVYNEREVNAWLSNQNFIQSKSFSLHSPAAHTRAQVERAAEARKNFYEELRKYEQNTDFNTKVRNLRPTLFY